MSEETSAAVSPVVAEAVRDEVEGFFQLEDITLDWPRPGYIRFRGVFLRDLESCYDSLSERLRRYGFTPMVRREGDAIALIAAPMLYEHSPSDWRINLVLFLATILTTLWVGAANEPGFTGYEIWMGWPFSLSMLLILGAHELGHYFAARHHKAPVTLPYFIPFPTLLGTLGAVIRLKGPLKNRRALLDMGAAGPLAGLVFAVPILFIGLATSPLVPIAGPGLQEGNSILYAVAKYIVFGRWLPGGGVDVLVNQVAWAGWAGLLVTGLNLIPVGQLDGGHVAYVLFGRRAGRLFWPVIIGLAALALLSQTLTWVLWIGLLFLFGRVYAEPLDDVTPLDPRRRIVAIFTLLLFFLVFVPVPITVRMP